MMVAWWIAILFFMLGGTLGVMIMTLVVAGKRADEVMIRNVRYKELNEPARDYINYSGYYDGLGREE